MRTLKNELFTAMQQWLAEFDSLKVLGYKHDTKAGERARHKFCNAKHLLHFLYGFRDDGVFNASGLFWRVADLAQEDLEDDFLNLEQSDFEKLLQTHQAWLESYKLLQASKIAIRTDFTRTDIAPFVLEMSRYEQFCKIALRFESALLSQDEIIAQVRETILEHYREHNGRLHIFGEILKILPDDFSFKAVYEEDFTSSYDKGQLSKQELQERELWEDMQESCEYCQTHYYDLDSKQWIDVKSHWLRRIKERLESNKIFIDDAELESLLNGTHTMFQPSYDWWIKPEDCYYKHFHHYKDFFYYELKIFMDYYKLVCYLCLQNDEWLEYESYWHIRVRQELESNGIFMGDKEFESLLHLTHPIIQESFSWCEKISDLGRYEIHNFIVEYKERY